MQQRNPSYESSGFPEFTYGHVLPPRVPTKLRSMPELRSSMANAIYMASQIDLAQGSLHLRVEPVRAAYFRAALGEIVRTEDACKRYGRPFVFKETDCPLLHVVKLLRNYEVHIGAFSVSSGAVLVNWAGSEGIYETFIVNNLSTAELQRLDSARGYSKHQLEELLALFDLHQRRFGVVQLLYNTVLHVSALLDAA